RSKRDWSSDVCSSDLAFRRGMLCEHTQLMVQVALLPGSPLVRDLRPVIFQKVCPHPISPLLRCRARQIPDRRQLTTAWHAHSRNIPSKWTIRWYCLRLLHGQNGRCHTAPSVG